MLDVGDRVREYILKEFLGRGNYGEVWLAEKKIEFADVSIPFALKFLAEQNREGVNTEAVRNEVITWIKAGHHSNIVSVIDGFIHSRYLVIASEYVEGGSLRDWLKSNNKRAPSLETAVKMLRGILNGLAHLHSRKIIHRDLKPENILLKDGTPKIADFGVSRMVETFSQSAAMSFTRGAGSPLYMPPEAFSEGNPMPQLDVWSTGVMFYEMLSGCFPFNANNLLALFNEITNKEPEPLPADVPRELQEVLSISLRKDAASRFQTAVVMGEALEKAWMTVQEREKRSLVIVSNEPEPPSERDEYEPKGEPQSIKSIASEYFMRALECYAVGNYDDAIKNHNKAIELDPELTNEKRVISKKARFNQAIRALSENVIQDPQMANYYYNRANLYFDSGGVESALADYNKAIELDPQHTKAYYHRAKAHCSQYNYDKAIEDYNKVIAQSPTLAAYHERANAHYNKRDFDMAIQDYSKVVSLNPRIASAYFSRGNSYYLKGSFVLAIEDYNKAIELNPQYADAYLNRGHAYREMMQNEAAADNYQKYNELSGRSV